MKNLTRKFQPTFDTIKDEEGKIPNDGPVIKSRWKSFCEDPYRRKDIIFSELPTTSYENVELEPSPLYSETEKAIKEIKSNKIPGIDDIPIELIKEGGENVTKFFHRLVGITFLVTLSSTSFIHSLRVFLQLIAITSSTLTLN